MDLPIGTAQNRKALVFRDFESVENCTLSARHANRRDHSSTQVKRLSLQRRPYIGQQAAVARIQEIKTDSKSPCRQQSVGCWSQMARRTLTAESSESALTVDKEENDGILFLLLFDRKRLATGRGISAARLVHDLQGYTECPKSPLSIRLPRREPTGDRCSTAEPS